MKKGQININKRNISRSEFWQTLKNYNVLLRLRGWKIHQTWYNMPYGGIEESNTYNLSSIDYKF